MSRYRKIAVKMYGDEKFRCLSRPQPNGQSLFTYLLTGPQTGCIPGLYRAGEAQLAEELDWPLEGFREAFREVSSKALAKVDWKARLVWIPNAIKYNNPESPNVVKSWAKEFIELPDCDLKYQAAQLLKVYLEGMGKAFAEAFAVDLRKASPKALANQEQEQEQEQEKETRVEPADSACSESPPKPVAADIPTTAAGDSSKSGEDPDPPCEQQPCTSEGLRLATLLRDLIVAKDPKAKCSRDGSERRWGRDIDKLMRLDGRPPEQIERIIRWCQPPPAGPRNFWEANIRSGAKLREKFEALLAQHARDGERRDATGADNRHPKPFEGDPEYVGRGVGK